MSAHILIIDDEPDIRQLLAITITRLGFSAHSVENVTQAYKALKNNRFDLCLTDLRLPDGTGIDIVKYIQREHNDLPVIVITAHGSMDVAISSMKLGAFDFINKPVDLKVLRTLITSALSIEKEEKPSNTFSEIIGEAPPMLALKENILKVSRSQAPVFIVGESGSGKELVARAIHTHSSRKQQPFIAINCGAIPKELMESELFGHIKGSFTGAHQDKQGLFVAANGGTLLLDEIADLPLEMQVKLLRVIQEKKVRPIGSSEEVNIDVRILSATHKNLTQAVESGSFRSDLFYRINVIEINVPPLRKRISDIPTLSHAILEKVASRNGSDHIKISPDAITALQHHTFPGNVRELENILERAHALSENNTISVDDLLFPQTAAENTSCQFDHSKISSTHNNTSNHPTHDLNDVSKASLYDSSKQTIDEYLEGIEKNILQSALEKNRWHRTATAKELGITFRSLRYRLKKLGMDIDSDV